MKLIFRNMILAAGVLFGSNLQAQTADTMKYKSAKDLIELENNKNLIPTTKDNPPIVLQNPKVVEKPALEPKKHRSSKKKKRG